MENSVISKENLPNHVAIIMDGNGRWAKLKNQHRTFGHKNSISAIKDALYICKEYEIPYLTLYAFSTENWKRPKFEVNSLMQLLISTIKKELNSLLEQNIRLNVVGDTERLPTRVRKELNEVIELAKDNKSGTLTIALSYGSQDEILSATKSIAKQIKSGTINAEDINSELFEKNLQTKGLPNVDLLIRTGGEFRISNFLLWQIAYAELYFTDVLWPDFSKKEFKKALLSFKNRERRYGCTSEQITN